MDDKWKYISEIFNKLMNTLFNAFMVWITYYMCIKYSMWWILAFLLIVAINNDN